MKNKKIDLLFLLFFFFFVNKGKQHEMLRSDELQLDGCKLFFIKYLICKSEQFFLHKNII